MQFLINLSNRRSCWNYSPLASISLPFWKKNKNDIHQPWLVHIGKNCALCLEYCLRPQGLAQFFLIWTAQLANNKEREVSKMSIIFLGSKDFHSNKLLNLPGHTEKYCLHDWLIIVQLLREIKTCITPSCQCKNHG